MNQPVHVQNQEPLSILTATFQANPELVSLEVREEIKRAIRDFHGYKADPRPLLKKLNVPIQKRLTLHEAIELLRDMQGVINRRLSIDAKRITPDAMVELGCKQYRVSDVTPIGTVVLDGHRGGFNPNNLRLVQPAQSTQN